MTCVSWTMHVLAQQIQHCCCWTCSAAALATAVAVSDAPDAVLTLQLQYVCPVTQNNA